MDQSLYLSASAQAGNLGDLVLRRTAIAWARRSGVRLNIFCGRMPSSYVDALCMCPEDRVFQSQLQWGIALLRDLLRCRVVLLFAPGLQLVRYRRTDGVHAIVNLVLAGLVRLSGGVVVKFGRSFSGNAHVVKMLEMLLRRTSNLYTVRDRESASFLGDGVEYCPDVAVGATSRALGPRRRGKVCVSWRYDRPQPEKLMAAVEQLCDRADLELVVVTQVREDDVPHARLAHRLGARHVEWGDRTHASQLDRVIDEYSSSLAVVSNRLHALIFGWNSGALPIGYSATGDQKIAPHLRALGLGWTSTKDGDGELLQQLGTESGRRSALGQSDRLNSEARSAVAALAERVCNTITVPSDYNVQ
jgi:hypothetical protein